MGIHFNQVTTIYRFIVIPVGAKRSTGISLFSKEIPAQKIAGMTVVDSLQHTIYSMYLI